MKINVITDILKKIKCDYALRKYKTSVQQYQYLLIKNHSVIQSTNIYRDHSEAYSDFLRIITAFL